MQSLLCSFELLHALWAMLAALGVVVPEILDLLGVSHFVEPVCWRVVYSKFQAVNLTQFINHPSQIIWNV